MEHFNKKNIELKSYKMDIGIAKYLYIGIFPKKNLFGFKFNL